jgi:hypothetical protein
VLIADPADAQVDEMKGQASPKLYFLREQTRRIEGAICLKLARPFMCMVLSESLQRSRKELAKAERTHEVVWTESLAYRTRVIRVVALDLTDLMAECCNFWISARVFASLCGHYMTTHVHTSLQTLHPP